MSRSDTAAPEGRRRFGRDKGPTEGLPSSVNYRLPIIVTMLATLLIVLVVGIITVFGIFNTVTIIGRLQKGQADASPMNAAFCGCIAIFGLAATGFFVWALAKGVRDLSTPLFYARGPVADKQGGNARRSGNWLGLQVNYVGSDLSEASRVTEEQDAASVDRTKAVQPRFASDARPKPRTTTSRYLPAERIASELPELPELPKKQRVLFRVEPQPFIHVDVGDEVIIAHSRYLQHIYYVAYLRDGEWHAFRSKALI